MNDFLDDIGYADGKATCVVSSYNRPDGRPIPEFIENIEASNKEEDHHVAHISQLHNAANLGLTVSLAGLGPREKYIEDPADIPNEGDHKWFFHGEDPFDVNVELKSRRYSGNEFRPKDQDVKNCLKRHIPYLLIQNAQTDNASIVLLREEDLLYIQESYDVITHEIRKGKRFNPYQEDKSIPVAQWKLYYKCKMFDSDRFYGRKISYEDLKRDGSYDEWLQVVEYFRSVSGK